MDGDRDPGVARCALTPGYYISRLQRDDQRNKLSPPSRSGYCPGCMVRNERQIRKIEISKESDGAFAVVDIDTLWVDGSGTENHWKGRVCKVYSKIGNEWKMAMQTGVLDYSHPGPACSD